MDKNITEWKKFRELPGLHGATIDILFMGLQNHPDRRQWKDTYVRATVAKIVWSKEEGEDHLPLRIHLANPQRYLPGKRSWIPYEGMPSVRYCGLGIAPYESEGVYNFSVALNCPARLVPKGGKIRSTHMLYQTRKEQEQSKKTFARLGRRAFTLVG